MIRKLRPYFQAHIINILIDYPLKKAMNKLEVFGRLIQWAIELSEFNVSYQPRKAIKAPALVDFIVEFTPAYDEQRRDQGAKEWVVCMDGFST